MINAGGKLLFQELECRTYDSRRSQAIDLCAGGCLQAADGDGIGATVFQGGNFGDADKELLISR